MDALIPIAVGIIFGINVAIACSNHSPISIGCAVMSGCMFVFCIAVLLITKG